MRVGLILIAAAICISVTADPITVTGKVTDADGNPLAGAQVWIVEMDLRDLAGGTLASTRSDGDGAFSLAGVELAPDSQMTLSSVVAYKEGLALGWDNVQRDVGTYTVVCEKPVPMTGRVRTGDGKGLRAEIRVMALVNVRGVEGGMGSAVYLSRGLSDRFMVTSDDGGAFTTNLAPAGATPALTFTAPGYGEVMRYFSPGTEPDANLLLAGSVRGTVSCEGRPGAVAQLSIVGEGYDNDRMSHWRVKATTGEQGSFEIPEAPPGTLRLSARPEADDEWQTPVREVTVKPGETAQADLELVKTHAIVGRVLDAATGDPIQGVTIHLSSPLISAAAARPAQSDEDGRFTLRAPPGEASCYISGVPDEYVLPDWAGRSRTATIKDEDVSLPDLRLVKGTKLQFLVVDTEGKPVPDAELRIEAGDDYSPFARHKANKDGECELSSIALDKTISVSARKGNAMTPEPLEVDPAKTKSVKLVLQPNAGCAVRVHVVDQDGNPKPDVSVDAYWQNERYGTVAKTEKTDGDGNCELGGLWPEGKYRLAVRADDCDVARTGDWEAKSGEAHDFGEVTLTEAKGFIAGIVKDADGKPVAGAKVTNSGNGPTAVEAITDENGRFRLEHLYAGGAPLIAQKGDLFGGAILQTGTEDGVITITPEQEVEALGSPTIPGPLVDRETELKTAHELILEALKVPIPEGHDYYVGQLLGQLSRFDSDKALEMSAEYGGKHDSTIMQAIGKHLLKDSPDEAIAYLEGIPHTESRIAAMWQAADSLKADAPERAKAILMGIVPETQTISEPGYRVSYMAAAGERLWELDPQAGEPVIRKTAEFAKCLGYGEREAYARGCAAEALCRIDLDGALELIEGITEGHEATRHQPNIAARIAKTQPDRAIELLNSVDEGNRRYKLPRVAYNMAAAHPDKVREVAALTEDASAKARCLGYAALAMRESDPGQAAKLFREAVDIVVAEKPRADSPWEAYQTSGTVAEMAQIACEIGYPGAQRLAWKAVSFIPPPSRDAWGASGQEGACPLNLAFACPELARGMVEAQLDTLSKITGTYSGLLDSMVLAASCVDAELAARLVRALPDDPADSESAWKLRQYMAAIDILVREPEERYVQVMSRYGTWVPGDMSPD